MNGDFTTYITFLRLPELDQRSSNRPGARLTLYHLPQFLVLFGAEFVGAGIASMGTVGAREVVPWAGGTVFPGVLRRTTI
jgi:hypothetical protein